MNFFKQLWENFKTHIVYILIICLLVLSLTISINRCSNVSREYKNNIEALNDTIKYYQDKHGNLVATKLAFESDINTLKLLNRSLYDQIDSLKLKKDNVAQIIYVGGQIENPKKDTAYVISHDTISKGFSKDFNFNNKYRVLEGNVDYQNDSLGIFINKDIINFDYTVAMDKDNRIYIKSTNPYVKYSEISGFTIPQEKQKHWSLGIFGNYNYSPTHNFKYLDLGMGLNYTIKKFTIGPKIYVEQDFLEKKRYFFVGGSLNWNILEW